jgi:hypothetical protein
MKRNMGDSLALMLSALVKREAYKARFRFLRAISGVLSHKGFEVRRQALASSELAKACPFPRPRPLISAIPLPVKGAFAAATLSSISAMGRRPNGQHHA